MTKKQLRTSTRVAYVAPKCDALKLDVGGVICQSDPILVLSLELDREGYGDVIEF